MHAPVVCLSPCLYLPVVIVHSGLSTQRSSSSSYSSTPTMAPSPTPPSTIMEEPSEAEAARSRSVVKPPT